MKALLLLLSVLVLFESTIYPAFSAFRETEVDSCCQDTCSDDNDHTDDDCDTGCNPFRDCGCCKGAFVVEKHISFAITSSLHFDPVLAIPYLDHLTEGFRSHLKWPPKNS